MKRSPLQRGAPNVHIRQIQSAIQEPVDEDNSVVKDLIGAGYSMEQSINAVERCETLEGALEYLGELVLDEEEDERDLIPSTYKHQFSREDSQPVDDFKMMW